MSTMKTLKRSEKTVTEGIIALCNAVKRMEDSGEYTEAARAMGEWWQGVGIRPDVSALPPTEKAAVLARSGALSGWLGSMQQVSGSQEKAKDLISEAANLFEAIDDRQNWAETRSELAVCYWREGAYDEARVILQDVLGSGFKLRSEIQGKVLLRAVNVEISTRNYDYAMSFINQAASLIENKGSEVLRGKLYFHRALIMRRKAEEENQPEFLDSAIEDYRQAAEFYQRAGHLKFLASVEINLGFLLMSVNKYAEAHLHFDAALEILNHQKDLGLAAPVYDNKARTFLLQGNLFEAKLAAIKSVNMLREGGENATLAESLTTLGMVLSRGGNFDEAIGTFGEAKETALMVGDMESAGNAVLTQIEELQSQLTPIVFRALYLEADELLKNAPKISTINRLQRIARRQFEVGGFGSEITVESPQAVKPGTNWEDFSLPDVVLSYEAELILKALSETRGRVTRAATLLGLSHQSLSLILHQRHKELKKFCVKRKPRSSRSKVKTH